MLTTALLSFQSLIKQNNINQKQLLAQNNKPNKIHTSIINAKKILVVGYSPTGNGHIGRTFNVIKQVIADKGLTTDDVVIIHCPPKWEDKPTPELDHIIKTLQKNNIIAILTLADKSVYGYLKPDGSSYDTKILERLSSYPMRNKNTAKNIVTAGVIFDNDNHILPTEYVSNPKLNSNIIISAKDLMSSLSKAINNKPDNIYVLTDMDPYLQKAAISIGIPSYQCVDQQNHAILLDEKNNENNFLPQNALLSKVLGGLGKISYIKLGDKNTLSIVNDTAKQLGIFPNTTRKEVKNIIITILLNDGKRLDLENIDLSPGVMYTENIQLDEVQNIIYVYAHNYTLTIKKHIAEMIKKNTLGYLNKIFLFCGKDSLNKNYNAMHLAYLANADGITTAGAGSVGEFAYLHFKKTNNSRLLIIPISNHNEQEKNAKYLEKYFKQFIIVNDNLARITDNIDNLINLPLNAEEIDNETIASFLEQVNSTNTYQKQAADILFAKQKKEQDHIEKIETDMRNSSTLKLNRRFIKLIFQVLIQLEQNKVHNKIIIKLIQCNHHKLCLSLNDLIKLLKDDQALSKELVGKNNNSKHLKLPKLIFREDIINLLQQANNTTEKSKLCSLIQQLKEKIGNFLITGF